ncbi:HNH endonuclease [Granulicoccus phenolivorans]|uniref:HNH endonuclease n=1 Tax=Granulicoccus phenolivorans TaxID=266854 RepID=UPI0004030F3D|nr:HNH endonuclease signature motif containing protein [Granulicoccus phenolivorans]
MLGLLLLPAALRRLRGCRRRDSRRFFTAAQKRVLLRRAGYRCEHVSPLGRRCRRTRALQADHVVPWSRGGPTRIANGAILCAAHNRAKRARMPSRRARRRLALRRRKY